MNDFKKLEERYRNDATFHAMVNALYQQIELLNLTPSEIREAAMFAAIKFEMVHARPIMMGRKQPWETE